MDDEEYWDESLMFDSEFESGNLFWAERVGRREYDLLMQLDTNSRASTQWFYFSLRNMAPGLIYTFNIVNFTKSDSLFNYGMRPAVCSVKGGLNAPPNQWIRCGDSVTYARGTNLREGTKKKYYRLSFKLMTNAIDDTLYVAHSYPYTGSMLRDFLNAVRK